MGFKFNATTGKLDLVAVTKLDQEFTAQRVIAFNHNLGVIALDIVMKKVQEQDNNAGYNMFGFNTTPPSVSYIAESFTKKKDSEYTRVDSADLNTTTITLDDAQSGVITLIG